MPYQELSVLPAFIRVLVAEQLIFVSSVGRDSPLSARMLVEHLPDAVIFSCMVTSAIWYLAKIGAVAVVNTVKENTVGLQLKR